MGKIVKKAIAFILVFGMVFTFSSVVNLAEGTNSLAAECPIACECGDGYVYGHIPCEDCGWEWIDMYCKDAGCVDGSVCWAFDCDGTTLVSMPEFIYCQVHPYCTLNFGYIECFHCNGTTLRPCWSFSCIICYPCGICGDCWECQWVPECKSCGEENCDWCNPPPPECNWCNYYDCLFCWPCGQCQDLEECWQCQWYFCCSFYPNCPEWSLSKIAEFNDLSERISEKTAQHRELFDRVQELCSMCASGFYLGNLWDVQFRIYMADAINEWDINERCSLDTLNTVNFFWYDMDRLIADADWIIRIINHLDLDTECVCPPIPPSCPWVCWWCDDGIYAGEPCLSCGGTGTRPCGNWWDVCIKCFPCAKDTGNLCHEEECEYCYWIAECGWCGEYDCFFCWPCKPERPCREPNCPWCDWNFCCVQYPNCYSWTPELRGEFNAYLDTINTQLNVARGRLAELSDACQECYSSDLLIQINTLLPLWISDIESRIDEIEGNKEQICPSNALRNMAVFLNQVEYGILDTIEWIINLNIQCTCGEPPPCCALYPNCRCDDPPPPRLTNLTVSQGSLSPAFNPSVFNYTVNVPHSVSSITVNANAGQGAVITGAGTHNLQVGQNTIIITVRVGEVTQTYTIVVTRAVAPPEPPRPPEPPGDGQPQPTVPLFRMFHEGLGQHLWTTDEHEYQVLATVGWTQEGIAWHTPQTGRPVHRLFHEGIIRHHYTADQNEIRVLRERGWNDEGPLFYCASPDVGANEGIRMTRLYHEGALKHLHTADANEIQVLTTQHGWTYEGESFVGLPAR